MKTRLILITIALAAALHAEPVKFKDGTTKEATGLRWIPARIEFTTSSGTVALPFTMFDTPWLDARFPQTFVAEVDRRVEQVKVDRAMLEKKAEEVLALVSRTQDENAALKAELARVKALISARNGGVPAEVAEKIKAEAMAKWPGDFEMQEYTMKKQRAAWLRLNGGEGVAAANQSESAPDVVNELKGSLLDRK